MTPRTKRLAIAFLAIGGALYGGRWGWNRFIGEPLALQKRAQAAIEKKLDRAKKNVIAARSAVVDLDALAQRSLPSNPTIAQERYQAYLIDLLRKARIDNPTLTPSATSLREGVGFIRFSVQGETDMAGIARLLHAFYSTPRLQQIRQLSLNPFRQEDKGPRIRFSMSIEALALGDGEEGSPAEPSGPAPLRDGLDRYAELSERNLLFSDGPGPAPLAGNSPEHTVLTAIYLEGEGAQADVYDRALNVTRRWKVGADGAIGPKSARLVDLGARDAVLEIDGALWRWTLGTPFSERAPLTPEQALRRETNKNDWATASQ